jgi:hypothetical protein
MHTITQVDPNLCAVNISRIAVKFEPYVCVTKRNWWRSVFPILAKGLRVSDVCGDTVIVRCFVCTGKYCWLVSAYILICIIYIYALYICRFYPSIYGAIAPFWALAFPRRRLHSSVFCSFTHTRTHTYVHTDKPVYNDIGLYDTSSITSDILWHQ